MPASQLDVEHIRLSRGRHTHPGAISFGEAVALASGEAWTDTPRCVAPGIRAVTFWLNNLLGDVDRQKLRPYITRVINTDTGAEDNREREWIAADWVYREAVPTWLDAAGDPITALEHRELPAFKRSGQLRDHRERLYTAHVAVQYTANLVAGTRKLEGLRAVHQATQFIVNETLQPAVAASCPIRDYGNTLTLAWRVCNTAALSIGFQTVPLLTDRDPPASDSGAWWEAHSLPALNVRLRPISNELLDSILVMIDRMIAVRIVGR